MKNLEEKESVLLIGQLPADAASLRKLFHLEQLDLKTIGAAGSLPFHELLMVSGIDEDSLEELCLTLQDKGVLKPIIYLVNDLDRSQLSLLNLGIHAVLSLRSQSLEFQIQQCIAQGRGEASYRKALSDQDLFYARLMHDLRSPLNTIVGTIDLISEGRGELTDDLVEALDRSSKFMLKLVNNSLDLAKANADTIDLKSDEFSLSDLLKDIEHIFRPKIIKKNISFVRSLSGCCEDDLFVGDLDRLSQVAMNLVSNALKFTPDQGEVLLDLHVQKSEGKAKCRLIVKDSGIGIGADKLDRIFENYTQAETHTKELYGGTGLGLGIVRNILHAMEGDIKVESTLGKGTKFTCEFSLENIESDMPTILLLGDNDDDQYLQVALEDEGFQLVKSGKNEVESVISTENIDYVLADFSQALSDSKVSTLEALNSNSNAPITVLVSQETREQVEQGNGRIKPIAKSGDFILPLLNDIRQNTSSRSQGSDIQDLALKVLVVDDSGDNQLMMKAFMRKTQYTIAYEENGRDAVERCKGENFDLIFMDIFMPVMDGTEAIGLVADNYRKRGLKTPPIIAMTSCVREQDVRRFKSLGFCAHLPKPITQEKLFECISTVISYGAAKKS